MEALLLLTWQPALLVDHNRPGLPDLPKATPSGVAFFIAYHTLILALFVSAALLVLTPLLALLNRFDQSAISFDKELDT